MSVTAIDREYNRKVQIIADLGDYTAGNFTVAESPVSYDVEGWQTFPDKRVLYRLDTREPLAIVGSKYQVTQYAEAWRAAEIILLRSGLNLTGLKRQMDESHNGARAYLVFTLPAHTIETAKGDTTALQIIVYSSFDGSWCFSLEAGYLRMLCANKQVSITDFSLYKSKHTPGLNIDLGVSKVEKVLHNFEEEKWRWQRWSEQKATEREALEAFAIAANCKFINAKSSRFHSVNDLLAEPEVYRNKSLMFMWEQFATERNALGMNQWAIFNTMTHWSSHAGASRKSSEANIASIRVSRGEQVRKAARTRLAA